MLVVILASVRRMSTVSPVRMPPVVVIPSLYFVGIPRNVVVPMLVSLHVVHGGGRGQSTTCATNRLFVTTGNTSLTFSVTRCRDSPRSSGWLSRQVIASRSIYIDHRWFSRAPGRLRHSNAKLRPRRYTVCKCASGERGIFRS